MCLDHHVPLNTVCVPLNPRIPLHDGNTLLANPKGGTTVRFSLLSKPLPDAGWLAAELAPACRFGPTSFSSARTVAGTYVAGAGTASAGAVDCVAPGYVGTLAAYASKVSLTLNGKAVQVDISLTLC